MSRSRLLEPVARRSKRDADPGAVERASDLPVWVGGPKTPVRLYERDAVWLRLHMGRIPVRSIALSVRLMIEFIVETGQANDFLAWACAKAAGERGVDLAQIERD